MTAERMLAAALGGFVGWVPWFFVQHYYYKKRIQQAAHVLDLMGEAAVQHHLAFQEALKCTECEYRDRATRCEVCLRALVT